MRGDGPISASCPSTFIHVSPDARWTAPEYAAWCSLTRFPRMRGDGPLASNVSTGDSMFPPHARGWTRHERYFSASVSVSPACAGMDLAKDIGFRLDGGFPRMRGDGPDLMMMPARVAMFPPHARPRRLRRSVRFPRMRGDGPCGLSCARCRPAFPPHARGWTLPRDVHWPACSVSPACAGMDRSRHRSPQPSKSFPRMRGDGPMGAVNELLTPMFPPHARGWTAAGGHRALSVPVSPACAGMDRRGP